MKKIILFFIVFNLCADERDEYIKKLLASSMESKIENRTLNKEVIKFLLEKLTSEELIKLNNLLKG